LARGQAAAGEFGYASIEAKILDATGGTEDAELYIKTMVAGTLAARLTAGQGIQVGSPTGGDPGTGKLNATDLQINGAPIDGFARKLLHLQDQKSSGTDGGTFTSGVRGRSIPK
jgi:hypothetical protein